MDIETINQLVTSYSPIVILLYLVWNLSVKEEAYFKKIQELIETNYKTVIDATKVLESIAKSVDNNGKQIVKNAELIQANKEAIKENKYEIDKLKGER